MLMATMSVFAASDRADLPDSTCRGVDSGPSTQWAFWPKSRSGIERIERACWTALVIGPLGFLSRSLEKLCQGRNASQLLRPFLHPRHRLFDIANSYRTTEPGELLDKVCHGNEQ